MRPYRLPRRRPPVVAAALLALALLVATAPGATAQQQPVGRQDATVEGIVVHPDGSPASGVDVSVVGYDDAGFTGIVATMFTLGLACIAEEIVCLGTSTEGGAVTTAADGGYHASLPDSYVAGKETDTDWVVTAGLPATGDQAVGPRSSFEFEVNILVQAAPPLPMWEATPAVSIDGWQVTAVVDGDLPPGTSRPVLTLGGVSTPGTSGSVDFRLLEFEAVDTPLAYATAYADARVPHANGRTIYHQGVSTGAVALPQFDLVPPSRGASCTLATASGSPPPANGSEGCPVTDGNASSVVPDGTASVTVSLPAPVDVSAVFLTGGRDGSVVEVSGDGSSWSRLATDPSSNPSPTRSRSVLVAYPESATSARFVRVSQPEGLIGLTEVSVWSGPTARRAPTPTPTPAPGPAADPGSSPAAAAADPSAAPAEGGKRTGTLVVALAGIALVGAAAGAVAWARRRRPA